MSADLSRTLMAIYDAAVSDAHWGPALDAFTSQIGAIGSIFVAVDQVGLPFRIEQASSLYGIGAVKHYFATYGHYDEPTMSRRLAAIAPRTLLRDCDVWDDMAALDERPDYKWLRENYRVRRRAGIRLSENKGWMDLLALQFGREWPQDATTLDASLDLLVPHLAKAVEVNRKFALLRQRYRAALAALDHLQIGTCVLTGGGQLVFANAEAHRICALKDGVRISRNNRLVLADSDSTAELESKIEAVVSTAAGGGRDHEALVVAKRSSGTLPFLIEVAPLRDRAGELEPRLIGALVFIFDPENHRVVSVDRLVRLFSLTSAEADVCRYMIQGLSTRDIADVRGVTEETAKSQLKAIYRKTGARRRIDLAQLAVAVDPPIGRPPADG